MKKYFVIDGKKYVRTQEFTKMAKGEVYERIDIYDENGKKKSSNLYSEYKIEEMLKNATKKSK